ncbi:Zinc finger HIT domain-containing protein 3 [Linum perenne]
MAPSRCQVCNESESKYKCPSCLVPYCSLICFKKHKEIPCSKPVAKASLAVAATVQVDTPASELELRTERPLTVDDPSVVLDKSQMESLASCSEITDALKDESLRKLILSIDSSPDPETELAKAMRTDAFRILADKILSTVATIP